MARMRELAASAPTPRVPIRDSSRRSRWPSGNGACVSRAQLARVRAQRRRGLAVDRARAPAAHPPGVYALGHRALPIEGRLAAALLYAGPGRRAEPRRRRPGGGGCRPARPPSRRTSSTPRRRRSVPRRARSPPAKRPARPASRAPRDPDRARAASPCPHFIHSPDAQGARRRRVPRAPRPFLAAGRSRRAAAAAPPPWARPWTSTCRSSRPLAASSSSGSFSSAASAGFPRPRSTSWWVASSWTRSGATVE